MWQVNVYKVDVNVQLMTPLLVFGQKEKRKSIRNNPKKPAGHNYTKIENYTLV